MNNASPIGVFDSGVGGLSVLGCLRRELPGERFIYYGDNANAPYGTKPPEQVLDCVCRVTEKLVARGIKAMVIACNTATAVTLPQLRAMYPFPIVAMEPALKPASLMRHGGKVLVLATPNTLRLPKFAALMERYGEQAVPLPCPGLMELVEAERFDEAVGYVTGLVAQQKQDTVDALVLGCTHYVFLRPALRRALPEHVALVDGNEGTARQLHRVLLEGELLAPSSQRGEAKLMTSGDAAELLPLMRRMLKRSEDL